MPLHKERMPSSLTVRAMQSNMPLNLRRPLATIAKLLSWVCNNSFALSIGATIVCTTPPITAPAIRSRWKLFNPLFNLLLSGSSSSAALILFSLLRCFLLFNSQTWLKREHAHHANPIQRNLFISLSNHRASPLLWNCVNFLRVREKRKEKHGTMKRCFISKRGDGVVGEGKNKKSLVILLWLSGRSCYRQQIVLFYTILSLDLSTCNLPSSDSRIFTLLPE